jgi:3-oxo-5-alpha-steroid 4-dehydrogenase 1
VIDRAIFDSFVLVWILVAIVTFVYLLFVAAPYGRHGRGGWGPLVKARFGWVLMECPTVLVFSGVFLGSALYTEHVNTQTAVGWVFLAMWLTHYVYRSFAFPMLIKDPGRMPLVIALSGVFFNLVNAGINSGYLYGFAPAYGPTWFTDPRFLIGAAMFATGFAIHVHSDHVLRGLRKPDDPPKTYRIPNAGLFRYVSAPNYFGEMLQWAGWAIATWSLPGLAFFLWTVANLAPRARANHRWYLEKFTEYPKGRKALVPFVV